MDTQDPPATQHDNNVKQPQNQQHSEPSSQQQSRHSTTDNAKRKRNIFSVSRASRVRTFDASLLSVTRGGHKRRHEVRDEFLDRFESNQRHNNVSSISNLTPTKKLEPQTTANQDNSNTSVRQQSRLVSSLRRLMLRLFLTHKRTTNSQEDNGGQKESAFPNDETGKSKLSKDTQQQISTNSSFIIDPALGFHYKWLLIISVAVCYNTIFIVGRGTFWHMHNICPKVWFMLDCLADLIYLIDMFINSRTGYLHQGILVEDIKQLRKHYFESLAFKLDIASLLPTDLSYFFMASRCEKDSVPCAVIVRLNRLFRLHRMAQFFERTESKTNFPLLARIVRLLFYILTIIHWNACLYFSVSYYIGFGSDQWVYSPSASGSAAVAAKARRVGLSNQNLPAINDMKETTIETNSTIEDNTMNAELAHQYIYCFYWSTLTLTTIGEVPMPERELEYVFVVADFLVGLLIFATIVGNIGSMITNMNAARADFQHKMDSVKQWMKFRRVNKELEDRIVKWFDYLWANRQTLDEDAVTAILPDRLKAETAIHVHLETLKRVVLFHDCEPGLLVQLVLKLKLQVFSPGDFICRIGDVGKEMYIVKRGELSVLAEDCKTRLVKLTDGSVFGELSILNISGVKTGNRRTANVCSVGYSDLFVLSKTDLWAVLEDYPDAQTLLVERGKQILRKDNLLIETVDNPSSDLANNACSNSIYNTEMLLNACNSCMDSVVALGDSLMPKLNDIMKSNSELLAKLERVEKKCFEQHNNSVV